MARNTTIIEESRRHERLLFLSLLATLLLWNLPFGWYLLYPCKLFATWIHETSHGILMLITGAGFDYMLLFRDTSGLAYPKHGVTDVAQAIISSSGYLGTSLFGAIFLVIGRSPSGARSVLWLLTLTMLASSTLFLSNGFGKAVIGGGAISLGLLAWKGSPRVAGFTVSFLAAQSCINSVLDIRVLFGKTMLVNGSPHGQTDAHTVAQLVGGPHWLWAGLWLAWSFGLFALALWRLRAGRPSRVVADPAKAR